VVSISIDDAQGGSKVFVESAWIQKIPDLTHAREAGTLEWVFDCAEMNVELFGILPATP
jgi:hypothetical protein